MVTPPSTLRKQSVVAFGYLTLRYIVAEPLFSGSVLIMLPLVSHPDVSVKVRFEPRMVNMPFDVDE